MKRRAERNAGEIAYRCVIWLHLVAVALSVACRGFVPVPVEAPGEGAKAKEGYALTRPMIEALGRYYADNQTYPDRLEELAPEYLDEIPAWEEALGIDEILYERTDSSYRLRFTYYGPGMNLCSYTPEQHDWDCSGAY